MNNKTQTMRVKFKKEHKNAVLPTYAKEGDAGLDLTATEIVNKNQYYEVLFGVSVEIPKGFFGLIIPRSGITNLNLMLKNSVGVIDSGFRGELRARFKKVKFEQNVIDGLKHEHYYEVGERAAQLVILPYSTIETEWSDDLENSERGNSGFGSSGK